MKAQCNLFGRHGGIAQHVFHAQDDLAVYCLFRSFIAYLACNHGQIIRGNAKPVGIISRCMVFHAMVEHKVVEPHAYGFRRAFVLFHLAVAVVLLPFAVVIKGESMQQVRKDGPPIDVCMVVAYMLQQVHPYVHGVFHRQYGHCVNGIVQAAWNVIKSLFCKIPAHQPIECFEIPGPRDKCREHVRWYNGHHASPEGMAPEQQSQFRFSLATVDDYIGRRVAFPPRSKVLHVRFPDKAALTFHDWVGSICGFVCKDR